METDFVFAIPFAQNLATMVSNDKIFKSLQSCSGSIIPVDIVATVITKV